MSDLHDWVVRVYNKNNKVIAKWIIEDRTEHDASREAESAVETCYQRADDWTLTQRKEVRR